jgi:hypothetical protein
MLGPKPPEIVWTDAEALELEVVVEDVPTQAALEPAIERAHAWGADLLFARLSPAERASRAPDRAGALSRCRGTAVDRRRLTAVVRPERAGGLSPGAWYVARILEGAQPGELAIERPKDFEFAVNRATLADLGLTLPEHVALQVTEWIG